MTSHELNDIYFDWLMQLVCEDERVDCRNYYKLFGLLHDTIFYSLVPMDENRADDGIELRYRFGYEKGIEARIIASELDYRPCSVLEMLVALVVRCEEHIAVDPEVGCRFGRWFWTIMSNLGLDSMTDLDFDWDTAHDILDRFLNREYGPHGEGGLVYLPDCKEDLRHADIWYQMMHYLSSMMT